jgi:hypothetical protein
MRGVCALNMEAMSVLLKNEDQLEKTNNEKQQQRRCCHRKEFLRYQNFRMRIRSLGTDLDKILFGKYDKLYY